MKFKTTKKEMRDGYHQIVGIGYCDAQTLLKYQTPIAYSAGVYGWRCDYYVINGVLISTGYGNLSNKNVNCDYQTIREFEKKAMLKNTSEETNEVLFELINKIKE